MNDIDILGCRSGCRTTSATFQQAMDASSSALKWQYVAVYIDDVIKLYTLLEEITGHVWTVLKMNKDSGMTPKLIKRPFLSDAIDYFGQVITPIICKFLMKQKTLSKLSRMRRIALS